MVWWSGGVVVTVMVTVMMCVCVGCGGVMV
jgi:hypothetical protein